MSDASINSAMEEKKIFLNEVAERLQCLNRQMAVWDYNSRMSNKYEEGRKKGIEEGRKEVIEKAIEEGRKKNREEIAVQMLKDNFPIETIQRYTSFSQAQIEQLAKENSLQ